jgi:CRP-like cAMP-binding protein
MKPSSVWVRRLACSASLTLEDQRVLEEIGAGARLCAAHESLAKAGDPADRLFVVLNGIASRFKLLPDGRRQILAYLLPGDMCDSRQLLQSQFDHSICTQIPSEVATLSAGTVQRLERYPNIALAMSRYAVTQQAIAREWLVNVGHRTAFERIGHLICEIFTRLEAVGLTQDYAFELPLTQAELGDTLALSSVHVNRTLMELRRLKLVTFQNRQIRIHDFTALRAASGFESAYLYSSVDPATTSVPARA